MSSRQPLLAPRAPRRRVALLGGVALATLLTVLVGQETARAVVPGVNGQIAFRSDRDEGKGEIYTMNADGTEVVRRTTNAAQDALPAWSPDGSKIAFISDRDGNGEIYTMNADGTGVVRRTTNAAADSQPTWSPDGTKIAFMTNRDGNQEVYTMNADGTGQVNRTTNAADDRDPAWSPDGSTIAFTTDRDTDGNDVDFEIYTMNADGSGQVNRTMDDTVTFDGDPAWSPDGSQIAFQTNRDFNQEIYTMNADGTGQVNRTMNAAPGPEGIDFQPAWSPDGTQIAFASFRDCSICEVGIADNVEIYTMNADGSGQARRTTNAAGDLDPDWGSHLADRDGDALPDEWEENGLDTDDDGTPELDLPAMGADPDHKDVFLELDVMAGHGLSQTAIDHVITAFANAPVTNPDLATGINLHVDNGPTSVMSPAADTWGDLSEQDTLAHDALLGTSDSFGYDWTEFDAIKAANFSTDREPAFHYVVSGHRYGSGSNNSSGISRGIGGSDLLVTLGPASEPGEGSGTVKQQAGTLMHELGHNLGLRHGGDEDRHYKANYLSIMNYSFQMGWLTRANGTSVLDYSRFQIPLSESALNETSGFGLPAASPAAAFKTLAGCPNDPAPANDPSILEPTPLLAGAVDWNCNTLPDGTVAADINDDGSTTGFTTSINDWLALVYDGGAIGSPGGTVALPQTTEMIEPQLEELLRNEQALSGELRPLPVAVPPATTPPPTTSTTPAKKRCKKGRKLKKGKCVKRCKKGRKLKKGKCVKRRK